MRRPIPNVSPEQALAIWDAARSSTGPEPHERVVTARCTLVTPMFGGGVEAGEVDPEMPIRTSALRGQLRFWWRLLYGAGQEPADPFAAESLLWGGISSKGPRASQVALQIESTTLRAPGNPFLPGPAGAPAGDHLSPWSQLDIPAYALILERREDPALLKAGYGFDLVLRFGRTTTRQQQEEVIEALRWWASFAGVGARTRRGFGAVKVVSDDVEMKPVTAEEVEARGGWMVTGRPESNAVEAWKKAIGALQRFRQGPGVGRNPGAGSRPGRSRWPEPDTIRRVTGRHARTHEPRRPVDGFYPRAAFGLPIVFHFKDGGDPGTDDRKTPDPKLEPVGGDRMASPLILRPWCDGRRYRPAALLLPGWEERLSVRVRLDPAGAAAGAPAWPEDPEERECLATQIEPMREQGAADPLSAFMRFFQKAPAHGGR